MKKTTTFTAAVLMTLAAGVAIAQGGYNRPPAGDKQYAQCLTYADRLYEGGNEPSPVKGQTKAQAWCTCMWNETPDDFKGNLVKFAETRKGKETNKLCEKHSDWSE
ncbi:hypothetical protein CLU86_0067 [Acidovorax sp. 62]|jgi:hypothetical protein|uniref:hypothetical protein n=1 Tax=Acidovorax sp. 62 TaxID=2035203 RepID=UPI000C189A1A|nr:hypothetical protein [Acidovorax sp. 62]PIF89200.1 hypothetical protein CLU86_0067 [Acidovorax sp. 62]